MKFWTIVVCVVLFLAVTGVLQSLRDKEARERWLTYPQQVGIAFDQLLNAIIPPYITLSYADETMSARIWRGHRDGRIVGTVLMPLVDLCFRWQGFTNHCERAYQKEIERRSMPPEYRPAPAAPISTT